MSNRKRDNYQTFSRFNNRIHSLKSSTLETFGRTTVTNKSMIGECKKGKRTMAVYYRYHCCRKTDRSFRIYLK